MPQFGASITDDSGGVIFYCNVFIKEAAPVLNDLLSVEAEFACIDVCK